MLKKLLKYDFKELLKVCLPLYGVGLVCAIMYNIVTKLITNTVVETPIMSVLQLLALLSTQILMFGISLILVFVIIWIARDFFTTVFGKQGYLTHTLPVSTAEIFWSKTISATSIFALTTVVHFIFMLICDIDDFNLNLEIIKEIFDITGNQITYPICAVILLMIMCIPLGIMMMYSAIALGHLTKYKVGMSIVFFLIIQNATNMVALVPSVLYIVLKWINVDVPQVTMIADVGHAIMIGNIMTIIVVVILGFTTYKIMAKKLNLI